MVNDLDWDLTVIRCHNGDENSHVAFGLFRFERMKQFNPVSIVYLVFK